MYTLTLTAGERRDFDFVGDRYFNGNDMSDLLREHMDPMDEWDSDDDITFHIPEGVAWSIKDLSSQDDDLFPCFSPDLTEKMQEFVDSIV